MPLQILTFEAFYHPQSVKMVRPILLLFCLFSSNLAAQQVFLDEFMQKWKNAEAYTIEVAELMPFDDYSYQPTNDQKTFQGQLLHMVENMNWLSSTYLGGKAIEADLKNGSFTPGEVLEIVKEGFKNSMEAVEKFDPASLEDKVDFFAGDMSKRQILVLMNDHLTHHRGQIIIYLRLKGIKPPKYRGW